MFKHRYLNVPIELIQYAHQVKMHKALGLYLVMKASCDGHVMITRDLKASLMAALGVKDSRSFSKHLQRLIDKNWIGYDKCQDIYHIRGTSYLRKTYGFHNNAAVEFKCDKDAKHVTDFIHGAILCHEVERRNKARKVRIRKLAGSSALIKESAIQELAASGRISKYIGLSLSTISKLLGVSQSQADRIKNRLQHAGYLSAKPRFNVLYTADAPDFSVMKFLPSNRRYSVKKKVVQKEVVYEFRERTYDEINSSMCFRSQKALVRRMKRFDVRGGSSIKQVG